MSESSPVTADEPTGTPVPSGADDATELDAAERDSGADEPATPVLPPPPVAPNVAPVFSGTTYSSGSNTYTDTAGNDTFLTAIGKLNATDADGNPLTFSVIGGSSSTTRSTAYGTFTITNASTGEFTYTPPTTPPSRGSRAASPTASRSPSPTARAAPPPPPSASRSTGRTTPPCSAA